MSVSSIFASHARSSTRSFVCAIDVQVGAYSFREGDRLQVTVDNRGKCHLRAEWAEGEIVVPAGTVNLLAGERIVNDQNNFHWAGK